MSLSPLGSKLVAPVSQPTHENQDAKVLLGKLIPRKIKELNLTHTCKDITNLHANQAQEGSMKWIKEYGQLGPVKLKEAHFQIVEEYRIGFLLGRAHPNATKELLGITADFATWLFAYDDIVEKFNDQELVQSWHDRTLAIINGEKVTAKDDGLMRGLSEIMSRLGPLCTPVWKARFTQDLLDYTKATLWEMDNRIQKRNPGVDEYKENRFKTSGTEVMFRFKELELSEEISDEVFKREDFQIVFKAAVEIVNIANDIISAPKETEDGMHNLLFAYKNEHTLTYQEALNHTARDLMEAFHTFESKLIMYQGPYKEAVEQLFSGYREWDVANLLWSVKWSSNDSDRYIRHWSETIY